MLVLSLLGVLIPLAGSATSASAQRSQTVTAGSFLTITQPQIVSNGQYVSVSGCGFLANSTSVLVSLLTAAGTPVANTTQAASTSSNGCLVNVNYYVPTSVPVNQGYLVQAQDAANNTEYGFLTIGAPLLSANPSTFTYNASGMQTGVSGGGFATTVTFSLHPVTNPGTTLSNSVQTPTLNPASFQNVLYTVPGTATPGAYFLYAQAGGLTTATVLTVAGSNTLPPAGVLTFNANPVYTGQTETATACGLGTVSSVALTISNGPSGPIVSGPTTLTSITPLYVSGCYAISFTVPALAGFNYLVTVNSGFASASGYLQINTSSTTPGALALTPNAALPGQTIAASACGYTAGETLSLAIFNAQNILVSTPLAGVSPASSTPGANNTVCDAVTFTLPVLGSGQYTVKLIGSSSNVTNTATLTVGTTAPTISASPTSVVAGGSVTITGAGFAAGSVVSVTGLGSTTTSTTAYGTFSVVLAVPLGTPVTTYTVRATDATGLTATTTVQVLSSGTGVVQLSAASAQTGQLITVTGSGFVPGEQVAVALSAPSSTPSPLAGTVQLVTATANGTFSFSYTVPAITPGNYTLLAIGQSSHVLGSTPFTVLAAGVPGVSTPGTVPFRPLPTVPVGTPTPLPTVSTAATVRYFADGYTGLASTNGKVTFSERLEFFNSGNAASLVTITYDVFDPTAQKQSTLTVQNTVSPGATVSRNVNQDVGNDKFVSVTVHATAGIVAEEFISRVSSSGAILDSDSSLGTAQPGTTWYLAEGYTGESLQEYITIYNPGATTAHAQVQYLPSNGVMPAPQAVTVQPHSQTTINVRSQYNTLMPKGSKNIGAAITSDVPVVVDRAMYWGDGAGSAKYGYSLSPATAGAARSQYFSLLPTSGGSQAFITVLNPNALAATLSLQLLNSSGQPVKTISATVGGRTRYTFVVPSILGGDYGIVSGSLLTSSLPVVAEAALYIGGSPNIGAHPGMVVSGSQGGQIGARADVSQSGAILRVFNPTPGPARVQVTLFSASGRAVLYDAGVSGQAAVTIQLPAGSGSRSVLLLASKGVTATLLNGGTAIAQVWGGSLF